MLAVVAVGAMTTIGACADGVPLGGATTNVWFPGEVSSGIVTVRR